MHSENLFLTLTYDDDNYPVDGSVSPREVQLFNKRLRQFVKPDTYRFYAVGEYGDKTQRPHYHLAIFGLGIRHESSIRRAWTKGFVMIGTLTEQSAGYIGGYVVKKMTSTKDIRLEGRHPEFARMSLKPGLGFGAMEKILDVMCSPSGINLMADGDVPKVLRHGKKIFPLGRYLRGKLREMYGFKEDYKCVLLNQKKEELLDMCQAFFTLTPPSEKEVKRARLRGLSPVENAWRNPQQEANLRARIKIKSRKSL